MWVKFRHKVVYILLKPFFAAFTRLKYGYRSEKYKLEKKPYVILSNHTMSFDPFFVALSFNFPLYFLASEDIFNRWFSPIIRYLVAPIPKAKSMKDLQAVKDCVRVVKEGGAVCIFPEGNRTLSGELCHIDEAIAKLVKLLSADVVLYNIEGGFCAEPRFSRAVRKGKTFGRINEIIPYEEVKGMEISELFERIKNGLSVSLPEGEKYKSKRRAEYLERSIYLCPGCEGESTMSSSDNLFFCTKCGFSVQYGEDGKFSSEEKIIPYNTVSKWYRAQVEWIKTKIIREKDPAFFDDKVKLFKIEKKHKSFGDSSIKLSTIGFEFSPSSGKIDIPFEDIISVGLMGKKKMVIYSTMGTYQIKENAPTNLLKYVHLFYALKYRIGGGADAATDIFMGL